MRKSRAIFLLITLVVAIGGYVAWAAWEPAPTLQSLKYYKIVDADARSAAEADFRSHPPKGRKLTWQRFWIRLAHPYLLREDPTIRVAFAGKRQLAIYYPREFIWLARNRKDDGWHRAYHMDAGGPSTLKAY